MTRDLEHTAVLGPVCALWRQHVAARASGAYRASLETLTHSW